MKPSKNLPLILAMALSVSGCIDSNYDLSDIDSTVKVPVNDLVIPINIDEITLSNVFNLKDDSKIKEINGVYAFVEDGNFSSKGVNIPAVHVNSPAITPTVAQISLPGGLPESVPADMQLTFDIGGESTAYDAKTTDVSEFIVSVSKATTQFDLDVNITLDGLKGMINNLRLKGLQMKLPKGLTIQNAGSNYNPETGIYNVGDVTSTGNVVTLHYVVTAIDFEKAGVTYNYANHTMSFTEDLALSKATMVIQGSDIIVPASKLPSQFSLTTSFRLGDIDITSITGRIKYDIDGVSVSDVYLNNLPTFLTQAGTDIKIVNPQIYLSLTNPLHDYQLEAQTGLTITSYRNDAVEGTYSLDAPGYFTIKGVSGQEKYNYYLSPQAVTSLYPGYTGATHVGYAGLSNVLSGDGIPTRLSVDFVNPCIPEQTVSNIRLGQDLGDVEGKYTFYAPLALKNGSTVLYTDVADGWSSEDLDAVTIEALSVDMIVNTDIPVALDFTAYPIDKNGNRIGNVEIDGADIDANAKDQKVTIKITGEIHNLDGICYTATLKASADQKALSPDMTIKLTNIRPRVTGYYEKEL
ncbi:MAG: hypothetical protein J1E63_05605 [Muribaculaceae bacterium]|nr:hypothetical protein [Muribaculaceae bacterium]